MENSIVRHILLGKFRPEMTADQFNEIILHFSELAENIPGILSFEHGANISWEGRNSGLNQVVILTFINTAARDAYLVHPDHIRFSSWLGELDLLEELVIFDFTPQIIDPHVNK